MSSPTKKFDAEDLPDPELNPLLNPILSANMGRWAEVYFTNPPEKRGQAVSDLLRELKNAPPTESASVQPRNGTKRQDQNREDGEVRSTEKRLQPFPAASVSQQICSACSAENSQEQKFCGMCGAPLQFFALPEELNVHENEPSAQANWSEPEPTGEDDSADYAIYRTRGRVYGDSYEQEWQIAETDVPHFAMERESVPYRYRVYIGAAVALLLGALVYVKWHGVPGSVGYTSDSAPSRVMPAAPARSAPASPPPATRSVLPTEGTPTPTNTAPPAKAQNQPESDSSKEEEPKQREPKAAAAESPRFVSASAGSSAIEQGGGEELATAEKYLDNNSRGGARDNREAAQWLWKSVAKGNATATLVLSDLYLRGDGVPKSCDQARLLLDAAARKGKAGAAARLRNLQAFGCQ